ncbi:MAG TPA: TetR/AcrR family transcriptional regulator, partial [Ilumatobacteraceae bacterium]
IVREAVGVFAQYGYDGASLRVLAAGAGMQKGHMTYYFPTKDDLLFEIVNDLHERFVQGIAEWTKDSPLNSEDLLLHVFSEHTKLVCAAHEQTRVAYESFRFLTAERQAIVVAKRRRYEHEVTLCIDRCRTDRFAIATTPTQFLTKSVLGLLNWTYHWYSSAGSHSPEELAVIFSQSAMAALRPPMHGHVKA